MNAELLLKHFHQLGDAADAVPRLRRFILDLAVRGKLVDQITEEGNAKQLLSQIQKRKQVEYEAGKISKPKSLPLVGLEDVPYKCPEQWIWTRVREITSDRGQRVPRHDFTYIDVTAINKEIGRIEGAEVLQPDVAPSRARKVVAKGDVLYSCVRPYLLNIAIVDEEIKPEPIASTAFAILNGFGLVLPKFLWIVLRSPYMITSVEDRMRGQAYPAINDAEFSMIPFPLPPLPEQKRIVAKVDELMALCDQLEAAQKEREERRVRLTAASWQALTTSGTKPETAFALEQLPQLIARPQQIPGLRQTILDLAVRGKLVKQDPKDEPAEVLITRIAKEKERLEREGIYRRQKSLMGLDPENVPFEIPSTWAWSRLGSVMLNITDGFHSTPRTIESGVRYITAKHVKPGLIDFDSCQYVSQQDYKEIASKTKPKKGDVLVVNIGAGSGLASIIEVEYEFAFKNVAILNRPEGVESRYLYEYLQAMRAQVYEEQTKGGAQPFLSLGMIRDFPFPLPPLAEQKRIVAKVDELMRLCDELEATLQQGVELQGKALEALLQMEDAVPGNGAVRQLPKPQLAKPVKQRYTMVEEAPLQAAEPAPVQKELNGHHRIAIKPVEPAEKRGRGRPRNGTATDEAGQAILDHLQNQRDWCAKSIILEATGVEPGAWNAAIKALQDAGKVVRQGEKKGARYRVV